MPFLTLFTFLSQWLPIVNICLIQVLSVRLLFCLQHFIEVLQVLGIVLDVWSILIVFLHSLVNQEVHR